MTISSDFSDPPPLLGRFAAHAAGVLAILALLGASLALTGPAEAQTPPPAQAERLTGIAMHGRPALPPGFAAFPYVDPAAPKGGRLTLGLSGSFDSFNPFIVKGVPAGNLRDFVFETLLARSLDEPFSLYPLIAESLEVPADRSSVTFHLDARARFSDGTALTADDVLFSFQMLRDLGRPNHRTYYKKVKSADKLSPHAVRFTLDGGGDREMPLILGLMPIVPRHKYTAETFDRTSIEPPVGSGPYRVARVEAGRSVTYARDPDYWGRELPVNRGRFNFDEVRLEYFRDGAAMFEAFKSGEIDVRPEEDPGLWAEGYGFAAVSDGRVAKDAVATGFPAGMTGLVFNTRRPQFKDPRVRQALMLLFDFEWINRNLFHGLYKRTESYFERSTLSAAGRPATARERALLAPYTAQVRPEILEGTYRFPATLGTGQNREHQARAFALLREAGYALSDGRLVNAATKQPLGFEVLAATSAQERLLGGYAGDLMRLGIHMRIRVVDSAQYQARLKSYDYDMIQASWPVSLSPGNEQLFRWSSKVAGTDGSYNYAGVADPAVDAMIEALLAAEGEDDFIAAVRALDRVLLSGDYVIPLFHLPRQWLAYWRRLHSPSRAPLYGYSLDTWWSTGAK